MKRKDDAGVAIEDVNKIAFKTYEALYEFRAMPFSLTNSVATFQCLVNEVFKQHLKKFILVFFYDILVYSANLKSYREHVSTSKTINPLLKEISVSLNNLK